MNIILTVKKSFFFFKNVQKVQGQDLNMLLPVKLQVFLM